MPQENGLLEMEGSVENIVYHNDSNQYTVLEVDCGEELITVVGTFPYVSVGSGCTCMARGHRTRRSGSSSAHRRLSAPVRRTRRRC